MIYVLGMLAAMLGVIIGSFLNVVALRYNTGQKITGRSACPVCGKSLTWHELIPVLSFFALRGRCSACQSRISWQYPIVESATGLLFLFSFLKTIGASGWSGEAIAMFVFYTVIWSILMVVLVYDIRHKIIPDGLVYAFAILSLAGLVATKGTALLEMPGLLDLFAGPIFFLPFFLLWFFSKGTWIGLGDGKLSWGIGWFLGLVGGASAIVIGFWSGAIISLALMGISKIAKGRTALTMKSEIPFAPFLIFGTFMVFVFAFDVLHLSDVLLLWP